MSRDESIDVQLPPAEALALLPVLLQLRQTLRAFRYSSHGAHVYLPAIESRKAQRLDRGLTRILDAIGAQP